MERYSIDGRIIPTMNGGHGSGNFGHSGRPGKVGGSGKGGETIGKPMPEDYISGKGGSKSKSEDDKKKNLERAKEYEEQMAGDRSGIEQADLDAAKSLGVKQEDIDSLPKNKSDFWHGVATALETDGDNEKSSSESESKKEESKQESDTERVKRLFGELREEGISTMSPRYQAAKDFYDGVQAKTIRATQKDLSATKAPKPVNDAVGKFLKSIKSKDADAIDTSYELAISALEGWKDKSSQAKIKAELDSLYERFDALLG